MNSEFGDLYPIEDIQKIYNHSKQTDTKVCADRCLVAWNKASDSSNRNYEAYKAWFNATIAAFQVERLHTKDCVRSVVLEAMKRREEWTWKAENLEREHGEGTPAIAEDQQEQTSPVTLHWRLPDGDTVVYEIPLTPQVFQSVNGDSTYSRYNGKEVTVVGVVLGTDVDLEVGPMFRVRNSAGIEMVVYPDELSKPYTRCDTCEDLGWLLESHADGYVVVSCDDCNGGPSKLKPETAGSAAAAWIKDKAAKDKEKA
jgi:hypothetical protein